MTRSRMLYAMIITVASPAALVAQELARATQCLTLEVRPIAKIAVSGDPQPLVVWTSSDGSSPRPAIDRSTSYSMVTTRRDMKISALLNDQLPQGTKLLVSMASSRGRSVGAADISEGRLPVDLVTGIQPGADAEQVITYMYLAEAGVAQVYPTTYEVTFTLTE